MTNILNELDEVKIEVEELRKECRLKTELSDSLKKAHAEQQAKIQQAKLEMEKLAQLLNAKSEEIHEIREMCEELQSSLLNKDLLLQQISSANEKLRAEYGEKILKLETENKDLVLALDEASARILDLEKKTSASSEEIAGLKRLLSVKQEKGLEAEKNASKNGKEREEYILKLEDESRNTENQLKWKNEQFSHLEEAHVKLQTEFQTSKMEWENENSRLIDEISSLQATLDAQVRISGRLENELRISTQALAHEESRRKLLEIEVSECRSQFENVSQECEVAKSEIEQLTMKRDEEIAELRMSLRKKEMVATEMKYRTSQLEQENIDLLASLKEFQEARISKSNNDVSASKKLRNKLQSLEQLHSKCATNIKEKEAEFNSQIEKLRADMKNCLHELNGKRKSMIELQKESEDCQWLLEVKNDEIFALVMVLKSEFNVAYSKMYDEKEKLEMSIMKIEEENMLINQQLESKDTELHEVHDELKLRCDQIDSLKQSNNFMEEELKRYEAMLSESHECQRVLKQQNLELEGTQREEITDGSDALEIVKSELANKASEVEKYELELQKMKLEAENLKENECAHKQENASLLVILSNRDAQIGELQEQICELESVIVAKTKAEELHMQETDNSLQLAEHRIAQLKNELIERDDDLLAAHNNLKQESNKFLSNIKEKDLTIEELQKQIGSLDQTFRSAVEKEITLEEALKRAESEKIVELEEKNHIITKLEKEVNALSKEVEFNEKSVNQTKQDLETSLQEKERFLSNIKEKDQTIEELQKQIGSLDQTFRSAVEKEVALEEALKRAEGQKIVEMEEKKQIIAQLETEVKALSKNMEFQEKSFNQTMQDLETSLQENESLLSNIKEKDQKIEELQKQVGSLDQNFRSAVEKEVMLDEALKRAEGQKIVQMEEKNQIIAKLEKEVKALSKEVEFQEKSVFQTRQDLETSLEAKTLEMEEVRSQFGDERKCFKALIEELESEKEALLQNLNKVLVERTKFLAQFEGVWEQIGILCRDDELSSMLGKVLQASEEESEPARDLLAGGLNDAMFSPSKKSIQVNFDGRPPLTELNF